MKKLLLLTLFAFATLSASAVSPKFNESAHEAKMLATKVADWQIETFEDQGKYRALPPKEEREKWHTRTKYSDLAWHPATFYAGLMEYTTIADDSKYIDWLIALGDKHEWKLDKRKYHADDHAVAQYYLKLYNLTREEKMITPVKAQFDDIMTGEKANLWHWHWCDALFMAPPAWAHLYDATKDPRYLDYLYSQYKKTYDILWSEPHQLFFRDRKYFKITEKNGEPMFWGRGNGWVFGGLALLIPDLPADWEHREFFVSTFQKLAAKLKEIQRPDGTWSAGLLGDLEDYDHIETSGSAFYTYGLAWGIRNGILDRNEYEPTLLKSWDALKKCVDKEGMVMWVQPVGASPGLSYADATELYGSGAFLAAATEMYNYFND